MYPELASAQDVDDEEMYIVRSAPAAALMEAYLREWKPPVPIAVSVESLKEIQPFYYFTGWARHVDKMDVGFLRSLVALPESDDDLCYLVYAAVEVFTSHQAEIPIMSEVYRWTIMDDESG